MKRYVNNKKLFLSRYFFILYIVIVCFLTIGFSGYQTILNVKDVSSSVRLDADIRISGFQVNTASIGAISSYEEYNKLNVNGSVILPNADSYVDYYVKVINLGNVEQGISSIVSNNPALKFQLIDFNIGDKICNASQCTLGVEKTFGFRVMWNDGYYSALNTTQNYVFDFDFQPYNSVTIDSSVVSFVSNVPSEVVNKGTLAFSVVPEYLANLTFMIDNVIIDNYVYDNGIVYIPNVTGNVFITNKNVFNISYVGIDSSSFPSVIYNNTLNLNLGNGYYVISSILMDNVLLTEDNYTFVDNVLTIPNITGDLIISVSGVENVDYVISPDESVVNKQLSITQLTNFLTDGSFSAISSDGVINHITVNIPYTCNANKTYQVVCQVEVDGVSVGSANKTISNGSSTLTFDFDVNITPGQFINIKFSEGAAFSGNQKVTINDESVRFFYN